MILRLFNQNDAISFHYRTPWLYYAIPAQAGHEMINLRAMATIGQVDLYLLHCPSASNYDCQHSSLPNTTRYQQTTAGLDVDVLKISRNDATPSYYIVGVYSTSLYTTYQISFGFENTVLELQAGIPVTDHVFAGEYDYYAFYLSGDHQVLKLSLSPVSILLVSITITVE
jgi:hypothetical protein